MRTSELHRTQPTLTDFEAKVIGVQTLPNGVLAVELDRTAFYARSGGQAGDHGTLTIGGHEYSVVDTRYDASREAVVHHLSPGSDDLDGTVGAEASGRIDAERRKRLTTGHTAQHLAYLASVMVLGPRPATGGDIDVDKVRVTIAHSSEEGPIDAIAIVDAYNSLVQSDLEIHRWTDPDDSTIWWWAIDDHEPIPCGGTHLAHTSGAGNFALAVKRKGSKNCVIGLHPQQ